MDFRRLGRTGLKLSRLSLGTWITFGHQLDEKQSAELVAEAIDGGINFFDTAEGYADGNAERMLGTALRSLRIGRDSYCISTKVFWGGPLPTQQGLSHKHIHDACHASLKRLGTDYIDILFCHRPDPDTSILETMRAMHGLVSQGKILYWGVSRWLPSDISRCLRLAARHGLVPPVAEQPEYSLLRRRNVELSLEPLVSRYGLGLTTTGALASGLLTGKYERGTPPGSRLALPEFGWLEEHLPARSDQAVSRVIAALRETARQTGCTPAQLAIAWCLRNDRVTTVLLGASSPGQLKENLAALALVRELPAPVFDRIEQVTRLSLRTRLRHAIGERIRAATAGLRQA